MNTDRKTASSARLVALASVGVLGLSLAPPSKADTVLLAQTTLISGSSAVTDKFTAPSAGTVTVQLSNMSWPTRLSALSFAATSGSQVMSAWSWDALAANVQSFQVGAGTYFAHVTGQAAGLLNLGLYSLSITFKTSDTPPVPLPASDWLLIGGMFVLAGSSRLIGRMQLPRFARVPSFG
ncbi:MAG TPA: hypothetical protein VGM84_00815 [Steroidobacteraceae bacterium]|jgi:hypothetical protein